MVACLETVALVLEEDEWISINLLLTSYDKRSFAGV